MRQLHGSAVGPYCAICGQEQDAHRRSVKGLAHDFVKDVVNFDSRMLRTARALVFRARRIGLRLSRGPHPPLCAAGYDFIFSSPCFSS